MDMRHPQYRELRRSRNARELRKLRRGMRHAERRTGVRLEIREALQRLHTFTLSDLLFREGEQGAFYDFGPGTVFRDAEGTIPARDGDLVGSVRNLATGEIVNTFPMSAHAPVYREWPRGHLECDMGGE